MKILEELWYGNIDPQGRDAQGDPQVERALYLVVKNDEKMRKMLSDTQKEQLERVQDCQSDLTDLLERKAFAKGFRLAVRMMADAMGRMELPSADS